jgi:hypothetical protein
VKTCTREVSALDAPRAHPWTDAASSPDSRYYDFKANPWLIRSSLEDYTPWNGSEAVETFYRLVEWINAAEGALESNDCEFTGPQSNSDPDFPKALQCSGRLMILFRELTSNLSYPRVERLEDALQRRLAELDPEFAWGVVGTTIMRTRYVSLPVPEAGQMGYQLMLSFWAWGDTIDETMAHLDRLFRNLSRALREARAR